MWGVDLPLATLFGAPTLEALAAAVRARLGLTLDLGGGKAQTAAEPVQPGWTPLVLIKKGGSRRAFFCVHGAGGNLLNFRDFSERLSPDQPVFGLEARGVDGQLPPADSIEEMAELYLDAIRRTDRLVYELWQHAQSLPAYKDRTTLLVVPEMGRDSDVAGNGFANHRSGDESCRRVWLVALGAGVPKGTGTERPIRTLDVAPTVANILGFRMAECEGKALGELV